MPRLSSSLIRRAKSIDPLLPLLLQPCRDLQSARNELRWLRQHVSRPATLPKNERRDSQCRTKLFQTCLERSRGKPLQYILGSQPFGELDILCKPGVLIPRPETETYTTYLAHLLLRSTRLSPIPSLRILDLCTGTGCIPLLLHTLLHPHIPTISLLGIDISPQGLSLARQNLRWNITQKHLHPAAHNDINFDKSNVLCTDDALSSPVNEQWDIVVSNPPYISPSSYNKDTARSVRNYEPKLALVPCAHPSTSTRPQPAPSADAAGDVFYPAIAKCAQEADAKILLVEVADRDQAQRVIDGVKGMADGFWEGYEIWCDEIGDWYGGKGRDEIGERGGDVEGVRRVGTGNARAVVGWRAIGKDWLGR